MCNEMNEGYFCSDVLSSPMSVVKRGWETFSVDDSGNEDDSVASKI